MKNSPHLPQPTLLVSPVALKIVDALFRVPEKELMRSQLSFAEEFHVSNSRLSKIMTGLEVEDLRGLRNKLAELPPSWWVQAMRYPRTKQRMSSYFETDHTFVSKNSIPVNLSDLISKYNKENVQILPGPPELAKATGVILDTSIYLWTTAEVIAELKRDYRLVPATRTDPDKIVLSTPKKDYATESIVSAVRKYGLRSLASEYDTMNIFRMIWDLGFGDSRTKEAQEQLIGRILNDRL